MFLMKAYGKGTVAAGMALLMYFSMVINESLVVRTSTSRNFHPDQRHSGCLQEARRRLGSLRSGIYGANGEAEY
ncbi:hypothetical protein Mal15_55840 [Stieleria maiorica]|uniref:Uncharacterized protein n=1 Tax=Stieleria maiorica TaxID=2795974 RepID=A0A5B9MNJ5_9BACT|nr:hypothetical protein Mal15_55840 [Stieleria maiorica]